MLQSGQKFGTLRDKKINIPTGVVRRKFSERNKKP
jgi:hypothetical protein